MLEPVHLFLDLESENWEVVQNYGLHSASPPTLPLAPPVFADSMVLASSGPGALFAATSGKLSIRPPSSGRSPSLEMTWAPVAAPLPPTVDLYLHPSPLFLWSRAAFERQLPLGIAGFLYRNLETASLEDGLAELLERAGWPERPSRSNAVAGLVRGHLDIPIRGGHLIGRASTAGAAEGYRQASFAVISDRGVIGPGYAYERLRGLVASNALQLDAFLELAAEPQPIDPALPWSEVLSLAEQAPLPISALEQFRVVRELTYAEWRALGDKQKELWRRRLMRRVGRPVPNSLDPVFTFETAQTANVFHLEAVVEFYLNFDDPWAPGAEPLASGADKYQKVSFINPFGSGATIVGNRVELGEVAGLPPTDDVGILRGSNATVNGRRVRLDGGPGLDRVVKGDLLFLTAEAQRTSRIFTVISVTAGGNEVEVDEPPSLGAATSPWAINLGEVYPYILLSGNSARGGELFRIASIEDDSRVVITAGEPMLNEPSCRWEIVRAPSIVVIDPFGARLSGSNAQLVAGSIVRVDAKGGALEKVNPGFDTLGLPGDLAAGQPFDRGNASHCYRVKTVQSVDTLELDSAPSLAVQMNQWHLPAGVGGELPSQAYNLWGSVQKGHDHYDGVALVVGSPLERRASGVAIWGGRVAGPFAISSFSSRHQTKTEHLSSIRGNRGYRFRSYVAFPASPQDQVGAKFRNFSLKVTDHDRLDSVREARFYFAHPVSPDPDGKGAIRFHDGNSRDVVGSGSAGCLVHRLGYYQMRQVLTKLQIDLDACLAEFPTTLQHVLLASDRDPSQKLWEKAKENPAGYPWSDRLRGSFWLVRPEEPPLG